MRIESSDFMIELAVKSADGQTDLGMVQVTAAELIETFVKIDADSEAAQDQKRNPPFNRLTPFKEWLIAKGMPATISDELLGALMVRTYNSLETIQKKMLGTEAGAPS